MDIRTKWAEFLSCGLFVLPAFLGIGLDSFEAFAVTLGIMQILLILVTMAAPAAGKDQDKQRRPRR